MAQPRQKPAPADPKKGGTSGKTGTSTPASGSAPVWRRILDRERWRSVLVNRPSASATARDATSPPKPRSGLFRFAMGLLIFLVGIQIIQTLLIVIANQFHLVTFLSSTLVKQRGVFLLSGMRWFDLFFLVIVAAFYFLLIRYNVIPRDPFGTRGTRARAQAGAQSRTATGTPTINVSPKTRADRRYAASVAATKSAAKAPTKALEKPSTAKTASGKVSVQAKTGQTSAKAKAAQTTARSVNSDMEYARVKAAQRLQRRRATKR